MSSRDIDDGLAAVVAESVAHPLGVRAVGQGPGNRHLPGGRAFVEPEASIPASGGRHGGVGERACRPVRVTDRATAVTGAGFADE